MFPRVGKRLRTEDRTVVRIEGYIPAFDVQRAGERAIQAQRPVGVKQVFRRKRLRAALLAVVVLIIVDSRDWRGCRTCCVRCNWRRYGDNRCGWSGYRGGADACARCWRGDGDQQQRCECAYYSDRRHCSELLFSL
jgi:hypothetical protein